MKIQRTVCLDALCMRTTHTHPDNQCYSNDIFFSSVKYTDRFSICELQLINVNVTKKNIPSERDAWNAFTQHFPDDI